MVRTVKYELSRDAKTKAGESDESLCSYMLFVESM